MADSRTLIDLLDKAAISLLSGINPDNIGTDAQPETVPLAEKTRAFDAVVKYLGERSKVAPESEKAKPAVAQLKDRFNRINGGSSGRRRASAVPAEEPPEAGSSVDALGDPAGSA